ncbi:hypothetical protein [Pseudobdellovibrio sp. HCB154]|uniref:hypothetical protein n=1 Tax=Pseudobdellovibrio sp. HCB154 TaxID=3386277 RepID=UPI0039170083
MRIIYFLTLIFSAQIVFAQFQMNQTQYDEGTFFAPAFNMSKIDYELTDLLADNGTSQLCAPMAITHAFEFLKNYRNPGFANLPAVADLDNDGIENTFKDRVRYFFQTCSTDRNEGTRYRQAIGCMDTFIKQSNYNSWAYMIGPHSINAPAGSPLDAVQHVLRLSEIKYYVAHQAAVLMGIGWYKFNPATQIWERTGGHFFNLYGYANMAGWGEDQADLFVVNSWIDYRSRPANEQFDTVKITSTGYLNQASMPAEVAYELAGEGFNFAEYKAFVEDIFVAFPY